MTKERKYSRLYDEYPADSDEDPTPRPPELDALLDAIAGHPVTADRAPTTDPQPEPEQKPTTDRPRAWFEHCNCTQCVELRFKKSEIQRQREDEGKEPKP